VNARWGSALRVRRHRFGAKHASLRRKALDNAVRLDFADQHKRFATLQNSLYCESVLRLAKITVAKYFIQKRSVRV